MLQGPILAHRFPFCHSQQHTRTPTCFLLGALFVFLSCASLASVPACHFAVPSPFAESVSQCPRTTAGSPYGVNSTCTSAIMQRPGTFFEALFGFKEGEYSAARHLLFNKVVFEAKSRGVAGGNGTRVVKERAVFEHPSLGNAHPVSSGWHSTPSVAELRAETAAMVCGFEQTHPGLLERLRAASSLPGVQCAHVIGESGAMHRRHRNGFFQAASQSNLLEFMSSELTPENGVTHYTYDRTQGPACALACMAGTAYRNYLIHPDLFSSSKSDAGAVFDTADTAAEERARGQQAPHQLNMLDDLTAYLTQEHKALSPKLVPAPRLRENHFYTIQNGYFEPTDAMANFPARLAWIAAAQGVTADVVEEAMVSRLRIGLVEDATVTLPLHKRCVEPISPDELHEVSQSYNSALSLPAREQCTAAQWAGVESLARIVLRGTYEATLLAGVQHTLRFLERQEHTGETPLPTLDTDVIAAVPPPALPPIFLTKVGGGVFYNEPGWIASAIESAVQRTAKLMVPLDVRLVHFRYVEEYYADYFRSWPILDNA